jgi:hypothetical protein
MKTKYDTGDEVLIPVKIRYATKLMGEIFYAIEGLQDKYGDILVPEGIIEGKAIIGKEKYIKDRWKKSCKDISSVN